MEEQLTDTDKQIMASFPSLELIYPIAVASYEAMTKRFDAMDGRIQTMTAFAVTASLALPTLGKTQNVSFFSVWFGVGIALILLAIGSAVFARMTGEIWMLDPANLKKGARQLPISTFKSYMICYAADDFEKNKRELSRKWTLTVISMALFALAILSLFLWLLVGRPISPAVLLPT